MQTKILPRWDDLDVPIYELSHELLIDANSILERNNELEGSEDYKPWLTPELAVQTLIGVAGILMNPAYQDGEDDGQSFCPLCHRG